MSTVVMHSVVSVDGYIADDADQVGPLFDWYSSRTGPSVMDGTRRRRTTSSATWLRLSARLRNWPVSAWLRWRQATSAGRP